MVRAPTSLTNPAAPADPVKAKMIYASSKDALKRALTGIATELQANDSDDIEYDTVLKTVSKGLA
jgi:cofilin/tropomyosin-type actin-binding protein